MTICIEREFEEEPRRGDQPRRFYVHVYLDDSGKVHTKDPAKFVVFGGCSVDEGRWHDVVRQVAGAKAGFFPAKGKPTDWEVRSIDFLHLQCLEARQ